jgi:hypothetical protein
MNPVQAVKTDKETLMMRIQKYQSSRRFGKLITKDLKINYTREQLVKMSVDRLNTILHRIKLNLNNRNMDAMVKHMATTCALGYETTVSQFYDITGFSDLLLANPGFHDALEIWAIEREMPDIPPGLQLTYIIASTTLAAHTLNATNDTKIEVKPASPDLVIKDEDRSDFKIGNEF